MKLKYNVFNSILNIDINKKSSCYITLCCNVKGFSFHFKFCDSAVFIFFEILLFATICYSKYWNWSLLRSYISRMFSQIDFQDWMEDSRESFLEISLLSVLRKKPILALHVFPVDLIQRAKMPFFLVFNRTSVFSYETLPSHFKSPGPKVITSRSCAHQSLDDISAVIWLFTCNIIKYGRVRAMAVSS